MSLSVFMVRHGISQTYQQTNIYTFIHLPCILVPLNLYHSYSGVSPSQWLDAIMGIRVKVISIPSTEAQKRL